MKNVSLASSQKYMMRHPPRLPLPGRAQRIFRSPPLGDHDAGLGSKDQRGLEGVVSVVIEQLFDRLREDGRLKKSHRGILRQ